MPTSEPQKELVIRSAQVREVRQAKREADFVFSTSAIDSYGDRVEQNWQLERFNANPVALWAHKSRELPIGYAKDVRVEDGMLVGTICFVEASANPVAEQVWQGIQQGSLRAVSVGFYPHTVRWEKENDIEVLVLDDNELFEISVTPIPANPEALLRQHEQLRKRAMTTPGDEPEEAAEPAKHDPPSQERGANGDPPNMTVKKDETEALATVKAELITANKTLAQAEERAEQAETKAKALETQNAELVKERDAAIKSRDELRHKGLEAEVDALIGVKFQPSERKHQLELAKSNYELFTKLAEQRAELPHLKSDPAGMGDDPTPRGLGASDDNGGDFANTINAGA